MLKEKMVFGSLGTFIFQNLIGETENFFGKSWKTLKECSSFKVYQQNFTTI